MTNRLKEKELKNCSNVVSKWMRPGRTLIELSEIIENIPKHKRTNKKRDLG